MPDRPLATALTEPPNESANCSVEAFERFIVASTPQLLAVAIRVTQKEHLAEDAVQDCLCYAWFRWPEWSSWPIRRIRATLFITISCRALNVVRSRRRFKPLTDAQLDELPSAVSRVDVDMSRDEFLAECARLLPPRELDALQKFAEGWSVEAMAERAGLTRMAMAGLLHRARVRARKVFHERRGGI